MEFSTKPNIKSRSKHPAYPERFNTPDEYVSWNTHWDDYNPVEFTHANVIANDRSKKANGWADPEVLSLEELESRVSYCSKIIVSNGRPQNPVGRTGMSGRGLLGKWGPNHAADPIVTRINSTTKDLEMVVILRADTGEWAIPGGMVDPGERVSLTLKREFGEEALGNYGVSEDERESILKQLDELFSSEGAEVYRGYVDDPRNTDNSWMETVAVHFHCKGDLGDKLILKAADDAKGVRWVAIDSQDELQKKKIESELSRLYASHHVFVLKAIEKFRLSQKDEESLQAPLTQNNETYKKAGADRESLLVTEKEERRRSLVIDDEDDDGRISRQNCNRVAFSVVGVIVVITCAVIAYIYI